MKQDDKDLLLRDLCGRLPYRVKVSTYRFGDSKRTEVAETLYAIYQYDWSMETEEDDFARPIGKPYLFPLSSMTSKQKAELSMLIVDVADIFKSFLIEVEFYHKHHFDYRGLIDKSLAIDATNLGIYK